MTEEEMLKITSTLFDEMGYDFVTLKKILHFPNHLHLEDTNEDVYWYNAPTEESILAYNNEIEAQIKEIESQRGILFSKFEKVLIRADIDEYKEEYADKFAKYAKILFLVLASAGKESYCPKQKYQFKHPSKEQRELIQMMLSIYPYQDRLYKAKKGNIVNACREKPFDTPPKVFPIKIGTYTTEINTYDQQKLVFEILADKYIRQGLNFCFPYGENREPDKYPFPIAEELLMEQMRDNRGGHNEKNWLRDLAYRIHFLKHIEKWFNIEPFLYDKVADSVKINYQKSISQIYPFNSADASIIGEMFRQFGFYDNAGDNRQRVLSLINKGEPNATILEELCYIHPAYQKFIKHYQIL